MGKLTKIVIVFFIILGVLIVGKNIFIKAAIEKGVQVATGLPLKIEKLDIGIISTHVGIKNLSLFNPSGFPKGIMFHAPEIFVDYKFGSILKGKIHIEDIRLDFDRFVIVKNKEGKINLDALKPKDNKRELSKGEKKSQEKKKKKDLEFQIDHMKVKVGKVIYKDYSKGEKPSIKEFKVNISEEFSDITNSNVNWLILSVAQKALLKTTLTSLVDFNIGVVSDVVAIPKQAVDTLKDAAKSLKDKIKLPFGK